MQIKEGYIIKKVSDKYIVIPSLEESVNFTGIITLNNSGKLLFEALQANKMTVDALKDLLTNEYEIDNETARKDVSTFIDILKVNNLLK